ncbi:redoxin domain-containing protein [Candidatus Peregrinibacteria bacterium]|nr:redoxin domain-containing protein [Candidatus Peregrinibacteria bacterium]
MNITLLFTSFLAGILTVLAPCVLTLLPVILGGALIDKNKWRPLIITASLAISVVVFTLLLKVLTIFIMVPPQFWQILSGGIILIFGFFLLVPEAWDWISVKLGFSQGSEGLLHKAQESKSSLWGAVLLGAALGPVFSACSPTYFVILATVLPVSLVQGVIYLVVYALGLALILLLIAYLGRLVTAKLRFAANPKGWFKRGLGVLLLIVGLGIVTGLDKWVEERILAAGIGVTQLEKNLLESTDMSDMRQTVSEVSTLAPKVDLPNYGRAPELVGLQNWINSDPLTLAGLRGKVVMIDFWTYSCINCIRTLPYLESWHEKYADQGLVIIGVHAPEFQFEKDINNVQKAVEERGLKYPIVQDNDFTTWKAYQNRYWPAKYIIDQDGNLRYYHFGEGDYEGTEMVINKLLSMDGKDLVAEQVVAEKGANFKLSDETYLGTDRRANMVRSGMVDLKEGEWTLAGPWTSEDERVLTAGPGASHTFRFYASTANLVMGGRGEVEVLVDGEPLTEHAGADVQKGMLKVDGQRLYRLTDFGQDYREHTIELKFKEANIELYAWTFG